MVKLVSPVRVPVAGLSYQPHYPDLVLRLLTRTPIELRREPDNEHDPNAISVWYKNKKLGHLSRAMAKHIAKELDQGVPWEAEVDHVNVHDEHPDRPGLWLLLYHD